MEERQESFFYFWKMLSVLIPGYKSIYGQPTTNYEQILESVPSSVVISMLITLNAQISVSNDPYQVQQDTIARVLQYLPDSETNIIKRGLERFNESRRGLYKGFIFGKRYLLTMIVKELNRNNLTGSTNLSADGLLKIFKAYLLVCDEINDSNEQIILPLLPDKGKPDFTYRLLWSVLNDQFSFNESSNPSFEIFKLICFIKYSLDNWPDELNEFLQHRNMEWPGRLLFALQTIAMATENYIPDAPFPKWLALLPESSPQHGFFEGMCINLASKETFELPDIKKYPMFRDLQGQYRIIDNDFFHKKIYKGVLFDLRTETNLKERFKNIPDYLNTVASRMMELLCFRSIIKCLPVSAHDIVHFDDKTDNIPDCYFRTGKDIFLIEFKDNMFPEKPKSDSGYEKIKSFIDERFALNSDGKRKGVYQILHQIKLLQEKQYDFDEKINKQLAGKTVTIYSILCINEFHVNIPGINQYLNDIFITESQKILHQNVRLKPLTIISLEILYELYFRGYSLDHLAVLIERYWKVIQNRRIKNEQDVMLPLQYRSMESFDEVFFELFRKDLQSTKDDENRLRKLVNTVGLSEEIINSPIKQNSGHIRH